MRRHLLMRGGTAIVLSALISACGPSMRRLMPPAVAEAQTSILGADVFAAERAYMAAVTLAVDAAGLAVTAASGALDPNDPAVLRQVFLDSVAAGDVAAGARLLDVWQPASNDAEAFAAILRLAIDAGDLEQAHTLAWSCVEFFEDERPRFMALWYESWAADPTFLDEVHTIVPGEDLTSLESLGGGSTVTLKFKMDDETIGAFKPMQTHLQSNYRAELAAYRLCTLIHCEFEVPRNREVRIRQEDFLTLYGLDSLEHTTGYANHFDALVWYEEDGDLWLHGTLKEWVPGFTGFPIEYTDVWEPLLSSWITRTRLEEMSLAGAIRGFNGRERGQYRAILNRAEGTDAYELAHQISDLHVFDVLINNWDRYSSVYYGVNCQWNHGEFVSIDNGASFQTRSWGHWSTTQGRLQRIRRFSRDTINAIRWMEPDLLYPILFPPSIHHDDERERFDAFLERREWLLEYVDGLIARYGEDEVFLFE